MTEYKQVLTAEDYQERLDKQLHAITGGLVLEDRPIQINGGILHEEILDRVHINNNIWEGATTESIAKFSNNELYSTKENPRFGNPEEMVRAFGYTSLQTNCEVILTDSIDHLNKLHTIHFTLKQLLTGGTDGTSQTPSTLLNEFNRWVSTHNPEVLDSQLTFENFNERHIRGMDALAIGKQSLNNAIYNWLSDDYPDMLETVHEQKENL